MATKTVPMCVVLMLVGATVAHAQAPATTPPATPPPQPQADAAPKFVPTEAYNAKRKELRDNAMMSVEVARRHYDGGTIPFATVCEVSMTALKSQLEFAASPEEESALLLEMLEIVRSLEAVTLGRYAAGLCSQLDVNTATMERLRIELALMRRGIELPANKQMAGMKLPEVKPAPALPPAADAESR